MEHYYRNGNYKYYSARITKFRSINLTCDSYLYKTRRWMIDTYLRSN